MKWTPVVLAFGLILLTAPAAPAASGFEDRCRKLLEVVSREKESSFYGVAAKIRTGTDTAGAFRMLDSMTTDKGMGGMFYAYTLVGTYLHCRGALPDSLHRKVRAAYRNRTMYRGDTENHWVMYYTGIYLAAQTWPGEPGSAWFNGRSSSENFREAQEWLTRWVRTTATIGQGEFDSPTYMAVLIAPLLVLYDFAADPVMKRRAGMALDLLFADVASDHLKGNYCGGHSRDYPEDIINPLGAPMTRVTWLYFGEPAEERWEDARFRPRYRGSWETVFGALGSYRLPAVIERIALDRDRPYKTGPQHHTFRYRAESARVQIHLHDAGLRDRLSPGRDPPADPAAHMGRDMGLRKAEQHALHAPPLLFGEGAGDVLPGGDQVPRGGGGPVP